MQFVKAFCVTFCIMTVLFFLPMVLSWNAPTVDGQRQYGFPFTYYAWGGDCGGVQCVRFSWTNLLIDLFILLGVPVLCGAVYWRRAGNSGT